VNNHLIDPKTMSRVEIPTDVLERMQHRLKLASADIGVYAKWYLNDVAELLTLLRAPVAPSEVETLPAPPEDSPASSTRPEGSQSER
jgi:hypothetical protein